MPCAKRAVFAALILLALFACAAQSAQADPVILTITNSGQVATPGSTLTLTGFYTNPGTEVFFTTAFTLHTPNPNIIFNSTPFTFPLVAPLSSTANVPLLTVIFGNDMSLGVHDLLFSVQGFNQSTGQLEESNIALFRVTINPVPVPEPATMLLLGSGLAAIVLKARRRRAADNEDAIMRS